MPKVAESTIRRLSLYLRFLEEFEEQGIETVSSEALAGRGGTTSAQVRKDLSFFGSFGKRGLGYSVPELAGRLRTIIGLGHRYPLALIGAGKIGSALVQHRGFAERGFDIAAIFDRDPEKIGQSRNGHAVRDISELEAALTAEPVEIAVITTPADAAQEVADRLVALGVKAILNFAPVKLDVPEDVTVKTVNLALELEVLSYALTNR
ncbi:MAG: redox-sensing transcriptional repressor Rex [Gemmatimonadetes bacterium]|nr:redox-sensing transcriptional repressor Rex [Gemmatimonadota bacterium]